MAPNAVGVVIVNWNSGSCLRDCLASLARAPVADAQPAAIVVVDNGSTDDSLARLPANLQPVVLRNDQNRGFAAACNQGARALETPLILFLNPDTVVEPGVIAHAAKFLAEVENAGFAACGVQLVDERGVIQRCCARLPRPMHFVNFSLGLSRLSPSIFPDVVRRDWDHATSERVAHVMGSFLMVRRTVFESLGGFDERFFVYLEDLDLSVRLAKRGHGVQYLADARIVHEGGGTSRQIRDRRLFYSLRSRLLFARKHFSRAGAATVIGFAVAVEPVTRMLLALLSGDFRGVAATARAYRMLYAALPEILRFPSTGPEVMPHAPSP